MLFRSRWSPACLIYWPLLGVVSLFILWRGVLLALWRGGVFWRGTRYTLEELRRGHAEAVARAQRVAS